MNTRIQNQSDRFERLLRSLLGLALVGGVVWALSQGGTTAAFGIGNLLR